MDKPRRCLRFFDVFCLGLNAIVGSGIFIFPGMLAALVGPASIAVFLICGLLLVFVALCYAELGGMFQGSGGSALYAREAFGTEIGFGVGFIAWAAAVLSCAAVAAGLSSQLSYFHPAFASPWAGKLVAALSLAVFGAVNYRGIRPGAWSVDGLTIGKLAPLFLFLVIGAMSVRAARFTPFYSGQMRFGYAVFLALWALQGFEVAPLPAGETENPQRDVPRAVIASLLAAAVFYALIQAVAVGCYPDLSRSGQTPLVAAAAYAMGRWAAALLAAGGAISMLGFVAGDALGSPRYLSVLGEDAFRSMGLDKIHPLWGTPHRAIAWTTACGVLMVLIFDFSRLIDLSNLAVVCQYFSTCLAAWALRRSRPRAARAFRVPYMAFVAPAGCAVSVWLMAQVTLREALFSVAILAGGYALRLLIP